MEIFIVMVLVLAVMDACVRRRTYYKEHKLSEYNVGQKYKCGIKIHMVHQPDLCLELYADASYKSLSDVFRSGYIVKRGKYYVFSYQSTRYMIPSGEITMIELLQSYNFEQEKEERGLGSAD